MKNMPERALRSMRTLPGFNSALVHFVQDEAYREADGILAEKDAPRKEFNIENLQNFTYKEQLGKLQRTNPLLVACVMGSIRKIKIKTVDDLRRKGFGGADTAQDIDLIPAVVQSVSRIVKNCHPRSISTIPAINSLFLWTSRVSGHVFELFNYLGDCYRYSISYHY